MSRLTLDYNNMLGIQLPDGGVDPARLDGDLDDRFREAHARVERARKAGEMGFFDLPYSTDTVHAIQEVADGFGQWFENVVVLGIGGSALGTRMLRDALLGPLWNEGSGERREHYPRLYVVRERRSRFDGVHSRSPGSAADTLQRREQVRRHRRDDGAVSGGGRAGGGGGGSGHCPRAFPLHHRPAYRCASRARGRARHPVTGCPQNVGGRFSVLSAVGLLPAAIAGVDVTGLLAGAAEMEQRCRTDELRRNPAGMLATLLHRAHVEDGEGIHVLMPYSDRLRSFGLWFQQLWAESLGKATNLEGVTVETGPTPVPALGATDQHSLLQLLMAGPRDKVVCFISVDASEDPVSIPDSTRPWRHSRISEGTVCER